jgi:hypothetical protein
MILWIVISVVAAVVLFALAWWSSGRVGRLTGKHDGALDYMATKRQGFGGF